MRARSRLLFWLSAGLLIILFGFTVIRDLRSKRPGGPPWTFEAEIRASSGTFAQLFWTTETDYVEERSLRVPIQAGNAFQLIRVKVPAGVSSLRFDPINAAGDVTIARMLLRAADGRPLATFTSDHFVSTHQIASVAARGSETVLVSAGDDPWVILSAGCDSGVAARGGSWRFTSVSLGLASLASALLFVVCAATVVGHAFRGITAAGVLAAGRRPWLWLPLVWLLIFTAKLLLMRQYPVVAPFWDQWDGEARGLYLPYYSCGLSWSQMFSLHNEHRIFFSRVLALGLLVVNGQWDPRLQQVVNAGLHSATAVLLLAMLWRAFEWRRPDLLGLLIVPVFALPFTWENTLMGFQSAFYFFVLFSLVGLWLTTACRAGSRPWVLGMVCVLCGLFTAAGGIVLPAVVMLVAVLKWITDSRSWRETVLALVAAAGVLALGVWSAAPPLAHHEPLKAKSLAVFVGAFFRNLAWPWIDTPEMGPFLWLPMAALVVAVVLRRGRTILIERFLIGLGAWVVVQAGAIAYARGGGWVVPAGRYQDFLSLGFVANTLVLAVGMWKARQGSLQKHAATALLVCWSAVAVVGLDALTSDALTTLDGWRPHWQAHVVNIRHFWYSREMSRNSSRGPARIFPIRAATASLTCCSGRSSATFCRRVCARHCASSRDASPGMRSVPTAPIRRLRTIHCFHRGGHTRRRETRPAGISKASRWVLARRLGR